MKNRSQDSQDGLGSYFAAALIGLAAALISVIVLSLVLTAVALGMDDPMKLLGVFALGTLFAGAFAGGIVSGMRYGDPSVGLLSGAGYCLIMWLAALISGNGGSVLMSTLVYLICVAAAFFGSLISARRGARRMSPARRRRKIQRGL